MVTRVLQSPLITCIRPADNLDYKVSTSIVTPGWSTWMLAKCQLEEASSISMSHANAMLGIAEAYGMARLGVMYRCLNVWINGHLPSTT